MVKYSILLYSHFSHTSSTCNNICRFCAHAVYGMDHGCVPGLQALADNDPLNDAAKALDDGR